MGAVTERTALPDAGSSDLRAAADALRSRLPEPLGALADIAYNYRWSWTPGGPELFASIDPRRWELRRQPRPAAAGGPSRRARASSRATSASSSALDTLERDGRRDARAAGLDRGGVTPRRPAAFFCAEYAIHGSLPVYSGGLGVLAGDILKESSDRGRAAGGGRADVPPRLLPPAHRRLGLAARVLGRHRSRPRARRARHRRRRRAAHGHRADRRARRRRAGVARRRRPRAAAAARRRPAGERRRRPLDHLAALRRRPRDAAVRSTRCSASAACGRCTRSASSPASCTSTRATPRSPASSSPAPTSEGVSAEDALAAARERTVFTTHTPVPAGNDTYPAEQIAEHARRHRRRARRRRRGARPPRPHASRRGRRAVRRDPVRAALEPPRQRRQRPPRRGRARDVARPVARPRRRRRADRARHQRRPHPHLDRRSRCASCSTATSATGWVDRAADPATWDGVAEIPDDELWAARSAQRARADRARARAQRHRAPRPRRHARVRARGRRGARSRRADDRLRPPRRHLQAARPAAARRRPRAGAARQRRAPRAVHPRRQGAPEATTTASGSCSACSA